MKDLLNIFREHSPKCPSRPKHTVMDMLRPKLDLSTHRDGIRLRFAHQEDLVHIIELERRGYQGYEAWKLQDFQHDWLRNPHCVYLVLEDESQQPPIILGVIVGRFRSRGSHISHVIVDPGVQGQGYGKLLMQKWLECAQILKTPRIALEVRKSNYKAQQLYDQFGFVKRNTKYFYYTDNNEDAIEMVYDVRR